MDDLIEMAGIDAKHSNEDVIAPFTVWLERYGDRIGNFGGVDMDVICQFSEAEIAEYVKAVLCQVEGRGGVAIGTGNSIPDYVPPAGYLAMVDTVRKHRGA
jgi:uroporphyrinogen decarboxylase